MPGSPTPTAGEEGPSLLVRKWPMLKEHGPPGSAATWGLALEQESQMQSPAPAPIKLSGGLCWAADCVWLSSRKLQCNSYASPVQKDTCCVLLVVTGVSQGWDRLESLLGHEQSAGLPAGCWSKSHVGPPMQPAQPADL